MIPAPFEYEVAESAEHAVQLLGDHGEDAKLLAGGHSLLPLMKIRFARPSVLIDIGRAQDLAYIRDAGDAIEIGAATRHADLQFSPLLAEQCPVLAYTAGLIGDLSVRHRGTIGGSVAHGDPASDLPSLLLALDAHFTVKGPQGDRRIPASELFTSFFETAIQPGEVLTQIGVPKLGPQHGWSYLKFNRRAQDWAIVGVAVIVERSNATISRASVGLTNMGQTPLRAAAVEQALAGASAESVAEAAGLASEGTSPPSDTNATADYRRHLAQVLVRRAVESALGG